MTDTGFNLWQGNRLLGTIHVREARLPVWLSGVLLPASDHVSLDGIRQWRSFIHPGQPVRQSRVDPEMFGGPLIQTEHDTPERAILMWASGATTKDIPDGAQLTIRDLLGSVLRFDAIVFRAVRPMPGTAARFGADIPVTAVRDGYIWLVSGTRVAAT